MKLRRREDGRQGILPFVLELGEQEDVTARAGLPLVIETMRALGVDELAKEHLPAAERQRDFDSAWKLESLVTLIAAGGDRIEDIRVLHEDKGLERLLGNTFPSPDVLLDFLSCFHDSSCWDNRPPDKKAYVPPESAGLLGLESVNLALIARGADPRSRTATIDHDGTIIECHKRGTTVAYEGTRGYQPLVAVWAEEDLILADEFRDGNVAGGEDPLSSAKRALAALPDWVETRYFRADSASYYTPLLKHLVEEKIGFTISADMTKPLRALCLDLDESQWTLFERRNCDQVEIAEVEFVPGDWPKDAFPLRYVVMRITPLQQVLLEPPEPKYLAVVSNRTEMTAADLIRWHWEKAGTVEHVHRVMKSELGAGVMPSSKFQVNAAWFRINAITFNVLTVLKRRALPQRYRNSRPKCLRFEVFTTPGKLVVHQSQLSVRASKARPFLEEMVVARQSLLALLESRQHPSQT